MESKELGKRFSEVASNTELNFENIVAISQQSELRTLSQLKSKEEIDNFIDGTFNRVLEQAKEADKKEEDIERMKGLINQYGSFIFNMVNKNVEAAGTQLKELYTTYEELRTVSIKA